MLSSAGLAAHNLQPKSETQAYLHTQTSQATLGLYDALGVRLCSVGFKQRAATTQERRKELCPVLVGLALHGRVWSS